MFKDLKNSIITHFQEMQSTTLFTVEVDRDKIYQLYLDGFDDPAIKQEHTCNCCKSFLRQFAGIVTIVDNKVVSIWDNIKVPKEYTKSVSNLKKYIHSLPIHSIFLFENKNCGTDKNLDVADNIVWEHFYLCLDKKFIGQVSKIPTLVGASVTNKNVLKRALDEITTEALDLTLELIDQNSLYRGKEFEANLREFLKIKKVYDKIKPTGKDLFCWTKSVELSGALINIRNSSIGTLLLDISSGMELDLAVTRFEKVVAPTNYKRPTSLVTPRMIEDAKKQLSELGLLDSLDRRFAHESDLSVEDIIYTDKTSSAALDIFGEMTKDCSVNPKTLSKTEEISIGDFIEKIVPTSKSIEVLVENSHQNNLVSLTTAINKDSKPLFKWDNHFAWSYNGNITDSMRDKVVAAGGRVDGVFRFTHSWNHDGKNQSLMDLHVFLPAHNTKVNTNNSKKEVHDSYGNAERVGWNHRQHYSTKGVQDVDFTSPPGKSVPLENITFPSLKHMPDGDYVCKIHNWNKRNITTSGFKAEIEFEGNIYSYNYTKPLDNKEWITVAVVTLKDGKFSIVHHIPESTETKSIWGIKTNQFTKVKKVMLSPNYWNTPVGNKHYMFFLENCVNEDSPRGFFNEFLKQDLDKHRKVFEIVGTKVKIQEDKNQLSGLGFSETQKNSVIVRVQGSFKRVLKVNF